VTSTDPITRRCRSWIGAADRSRLYRAPDARRSGSAPTVGGSAVPIALVRWRPRSSASPRKADEFTLCARRLSLAPQMWPASVTISVHGLVGDGTRLSAAWRTGQRNDHADRGISPRSYTGGIPRWIDLAASDRATSRTRPDAARPAMPAAEHASRTWPAAGRATGSPDVISHSAPGCNPCNPWRSLATTYTSA